MKDIVDADGVCPQRTAEVVRDGNGVCPQAGSIDGRASNAEKVRFFRSLFCGREDVFARRYENAKKGTHGYTPCCRNQWGPGCILKVHGKCSDCSARESVPVSDEVLRWHLRGKDEKMKPFTMAVYPMLQDETVRFAVIDFDKSSWRRDALIVARHARDIGWPAALERSRSGHGAHLWFFFSSPIFARRVREALTYLLTCVLEAHPEVGLDSYDRIIPCQDTLTKVGFGNPIALPLQAEPRRIGNSVFVNDDGVPYADQWAYLSSVKRLTPVDVEILCRRAQSENRRLLPNAQTPSSDSERPWEFFMPLWSTGNIVPSADSAAPCEEDVRVVLANRVYVEQNGLSPAIRSQLIGLASFVNPEFFKRQRMKYSVYGEPRVISRALNGEEFLQVPRGCLERVLKVLKEARRNPIIEDKRYAGVPIEATFVGELRPEQKSAVADLQKSDLGILAAGTAFGKTVVAAHLIATRKVNTLILVNRRQLQLQWVARLATFLGIPEKEIGRVGGGSSRWTGRIDVALLQSLSRKGVVDPRVKEYGQIIVDECHAVASETFEAAIDSAPAKYVLGLSATVDRRDGQHPLIMMQCGPIRHRVDAKTLAQRAPFDHVVHVRSTSFRMPAGRVGEDGHVDYGELCAALATDEARNRQIVSDMLASVGEGRSPVVLSDRREHVEALAQKLDGRVAHVVVLLGGMGRRALNAVRERLAEIPDDEPRVLLATGSFLGEGFDDARLDTLFLALPVSWKGRLTQFAGRLHRLHEGKREVRIYDYADLNVDVCSRMYERRVRGYEAIGYRVVVPLGVAEGWPVSVALPATPKWQETYADSVRRLCRDGVTEALADLFVAATLRLLQKGNGEGGESSASAQSSVADAQRFLAERLETLAETRGRFEANVRLPIPCGANPYLEVGLLSRRNRLVVMFDSEDGLGDAERYRLSRREDWLLQKNGYMVVRFLAEDVCAHLGATLDTLLQAVETR